MTDQYTIYCGYMMMAGAWMWYIAATGCVNKRGNSNCAEWMGKGTQNPLQCLFRTKASLNVYIQTLGLWRGQHPPLWLRVDLPQPPRTLGNASTLLFWWVWGSTTSRETGKIVERLSCVSVSEVKWRGRGEGSTEEGMKKGQRKGEEGETALGYVAVHKFSFPR